MPKSKNFTNWEIGRKNFSIRIFIYLFELKGIGVFFETLPVFSRNFNLPRAFFVFFCKRVLFKIFLSFLHRKNRYQAQSVRPPFAFFGLVHFWGQFCFTKRFLLWFFDFSGYESFVFLFLVTEKANKSF